MRNRKNYKALLIVTGLVIISAASCLNSPESVYERMLDKYQEGKGGSITLMAEKFLMAFSDYRADYNNLFFNKNLIMSVKGSDIKIIYPEKVSFSGDKSLAENVVFADMNGENVLLGNNKGFCVFSRGGNPHTVFKTDKNEKIDAVSLKEKNIIYLSGGKMIEMSFSDKKIRRMDTAEYHPPYRKFFRASIVVSEKYIILATGIAGSYFINIFDVTTGNSLMKNIPASALEFNINDNFLSYVKGGTGNWTVERYEIPTKKRIQTKSAGRINNVFIAKDGYITTGGKNNIIESFSGERGVMPSEWNILGVCRNEVLIEYGKVVYILDFPLLMKKIRELNEKTGMKAS